MNYLLLFALFIFIIGVVFMYQRRDKVPEETPVKKPIDKKEEQPADKKQEPAQEPEQPTENKKAPEEPAVKIFNELTDCVNPTIIDD